jgi:hypothetical protein
MELERGKLNLETFPREEYYMRKYVIGMIFGFALAFSLSAHAEVVSMINKVVEGTFPVTVEGKKLDTDAVVIEGSTYLPVRSFGEAIGYTVGFDTEMGVSLVKKSAETAQPTTSQTIPIATDPKVSTEQKIKYLEQEIANFKFQITAEENSIKSNPGSPNNTKIEGYIKFQKDRITELEKEKAALQP